MKVIVHYAEIALKGRNRFMFENKLIDNIKNSFEKNKINFNSIKKEDTRIILDIKDDEKENVNNVLRNVFGIKYFVFAEECKNDAGEILNKAVEIIERIKKEGKKRISIDVKRSDKNFPLTSLELSRKIGEEAYNRNIKIDFKNYEEKIIIEITSKNAFFCSEKILGLGGLPVSSSGKVLMLFSGGIDSAAASWLLMKRGCRVDFLHFHTFRDNKEVLKSKIKNIAEILNNYQFSSKLFLIPYYNYQLRTMNKVPEYLDVVLFRNFILMFGQEIAEKEGYRALATGDSIGQVASQTLPNIASASYKINIPVLRPLITYDKEEIIDLGKKIKTYDESIKQYKDCCSIISRKPSTAVKIEELKSAVSKLNFKKIIKESLLKMEIFRIN